MTREENLHWIDEEIRTWENECQSKHPIKEALHAARKALEQEPTTKNDLGDDCVRRKAVLNTLERMDKALDEDRTVDSYKELLKECYKVLPSVTPQEPRWIPMVRREPTDEEKAEYLAQNGEELCYMLENEMPLNGQEVLVSIGEFVAEDVFDEDFYNFENNDIENVDAWMPLPKPYKAESEDKG